MSLKYVKDMNVNNKGTSKTNYVFPSTWNKEKAASLEINLETVTKILPSGRSVESEHNST